MKIVITGGAGFIGSHLAEVLLRRGHEIRVLDDLSTGQRSNIAHLESNARFHLTVGTVLDEAALTTLVRGCDLVYHLAAAVGVKYVIDNPLLALQTNIRGTENVLVAANREKCKVFVASTSEIYGKHDTGLLKEDDDRILGPTTIARWGYSDSKAVDEFLALAYFREKKLPVVIARLFNTVGPRQTGRYGMVIPRFIKQALLDHDLTVFGTGKQRRSFTWVGDVVKAMIGLMEHPKAVGEIVNIGNGHETTIEGLARRVKRMTGSHSRIVYIPYERAYEQGFEDMKRRQPDTTKLRKLLGFRPTVGLEEILERTITSFEA